MDFEAAAGGFSGAWRDLVDPGEAEAWVSWDDAPRFYPGDFIARVRGRSMEPMMEDGAWCLFRPGPLELAVGRPALVRLADAADDGGRFTVKVVRVEWGSDADGDVVRTAIVLESRNPEYGSMRFEREALAGVSLLAVVQRVLGHWLA